MTERKSSTGVITKAGGGGGADHGEIEAVFATLNVRDHQDDIIMPGAIQDGASVIISDWNHSSWQAERPIGRGVVKVVGNQARLVGHLFMDTEAGREAFHTLKGLGDLCEFSWSLDDIVAYNDLDSAGRPTRFITGVKIREVSPVLLAASIDTGLVSLKSRDRRLTRVQKSELAAIRDQFNADTLADIKATLDAGMQRAQERAVLVETGLAVGKLVGYRFIHRSDVRPDLVASAKAAVLTYGPMLKLDADAIEIGFFTPEVDPTRVDMTDVAGLNGFTRPKIQSDRIWINVALDPVTAYGVAAHEVSHLAGADEIAARLWECRARAEEGL